MTAQTLADRLEVSARTIYRDIADLQGSGVPIEGEAGVGYVLQGGFEVPPLMFTREEIVALVAGARLVRAWGGLEMARAAEEALAKIGHVLPDAARGRAAAVQIHSFGFGLSEEVRARIDMLEQAVEGRQVLTVAYADAEGAASARDIRPLGLWFWGKVWTLVAWCELRDDFRVFRVDRIADATEAGRRYRPDPAKSLAAFYRVMAATDQSDYRVTTAPVQLRWD